LRKLRSIAAAAFAATALASVPATGAQAQITLGQLAPEGATAGCSSQLDLTQFLSASKPEYVVPDNGVLTSWSTRASAAGQTLTFKVFRPLSTGEFMVVAHDGPRQLQPGINTFPIHIPVQPRDLIGLNPAGSTVLNPSVCEFAGSSEFDDIERFQLGDGADGAALPLAGTGKGFRANIQASFLVPPEIDIFRRVELGSVKGGGRVVIHGNNFEEITEVKFDGVKAPRFTVDDEHQITAIAPPGRTLRGVNAQVVNPAGTATGPSDFFYSGCQVPKLTGKKLAAAKSRLRGAGCATGRVTRVRGSVRKKGKVVKQSPKPGTLLAPGAKVSLKVGK
jgi:hypothetical protein